jgi:hypothetical protein
MPYKMALVEWVDSKRGDGWVRLGDLDHAISECESLGWVISESKDSITISAHVAGNPDQCCGEITIPRKAISKITMFKFPDKESAKKDHRGE